MVATSFSPVRSPWPANSGFIKGTVERKFLLPTCCLNKELSSSFLERRNRSPKRDTVRTVVAVGKHLSTRCSASRAEVRLGSENPCCAAGRRRSHRGDFRKNGCSPNRAHVPRMPLFSAARRISSKDPFGNTLASSGTLADVNTYRFSSQEYHQNSGLLLYLRRAYDPNIQRWLNRDPIEERGGLNLYGFVGNDSLNRFDPFGLDWTDYIPNWVGNLVSYNGPTYLPPLEKPAGILTPLSGGRENLFSDFKNDVHHVGNEVGKELAVGGAMVLIPEEEILGIVGEGLAKLKALRRCKSAAKGLTQAEASAANKINNILTKNLKPGPKGDISGAIHDMVGNPIPKPGGGTYDHVQDLGNMLRGLRNNADALKNATDPAAVVARQQAQQAIEQIEAAIKGASL